MGLCKCPKRKVTNLFCFEHRVNVCEHCMVANHPKCVVKSYLQWLQDSDYNAHCGLCEKLLADGDVVRLLCYDVFHWVCLDKYAEQMPANTAPAGYSCPSCNTCIFPPSNMASPVAENLRQMLSQVNWARGGLGLPQIPDSSLMTESTNHHVQENQAHNHIPPPAIEEAVRPNQSHTESTITRLNKQHENEGYSQSPVTINSEKTEAFTRTDKLANLIKTPEERKVYDTRKDEAVVDIVHDHDTDKYKRRSALHWFARWFKSRTEKPKSVDSNASMKRIAILFILGLIAFFTLVVVLTSVGRASADKDPLLDPMSNPNIRIGRRAV